MKIPLNLAVGTLRYIAIRVLSVAVILGIAVGCYAFASAHLTTTDYTFELDLIYTNNSGSTIDGLMPVEVDALVLVNAGFIGADGEDSLFTNVGGTEIKGFTQDMGLDNINWWSRVNVADAATQTNTVFMDGPNHTDGFPFLTHDRAAGLDTGRIGFASVADAASLDITDDIDINISASADTCGILVEKSDRGGTASYSTEDSWGMYFIGQTDSFSGVINNNGTGTTSSMMYTITPTNSIDLCGIFLPDNGGGAIVDIRIIDITGGIDVLIARQRFTATPPAIDRRFPVSPEVSGMTNTDPTMLLAFPVPLTASRTYLIGCDCGASNRGIDMTAPVGLPPEQGGLLPQGRELHPEGKPLRKESPA